MANRAETQARIIADAIADTHRAGKKSKKPKRFVVESRWIGTIPEQPPQLRDLFLDMAKWSAHGRYATEEDARKAIEAGNRNRENWEFRLAESNR